MKTQCLIKISWLMIFSLLSLVSVSQTDSLCNYNYITQQMDAYYDSIIAVGGDSALEGTGYKEYFRWKNHMYFYQGKNGDLYDHEENVANYFEGTRSITEDDGSDWRYFGPKGIPESYSGTWSKAGINGKGMILSVYVYPNNHDKILAGSHNSGLWKTEDGGKTWHCMTDDNYKIRGVFNIVVNPQNEDEILIASFNSLSKHSYGLFKSSDGGTTWNQMNDGLEINQNPIYPTTSKQALPRKLIVRPGDGAIFYVTQSYVFKAENFETNWEMIFSWPYPNWLYEKGFFDIEFDTQNDSIIYLSGTNIFKSFDNGVSWTGLDTLIYGDTTVHLPIRTELSTLPDSSGRIWFAALYHDTLSKVNTVRIVRYDPMASPDYYTYPLDEGNVVNCGVYAMEFEISPDNESNFYFGGMYTNGYDATGDSLFAISTIQYGPSSSNWLHVDIRDMLIVPYQNQSYRMYMAHDGGLSWADLEGNTDSLWTWDYLPGSEDHGLDVYEFYDFTCLDDEDDLIFGGTQDMSGFSFRQGEWHHFGGGDGGETVIDNSTNPPYIYYNVPGAHTGFMFRSTDYCQTLDKMFLHPAGSLFTGLSLHPFNDEKLYYASKKLYYWTNARTGYSPDTIAPNNTHPLSDCEIVHNGQSGQGVNSLVSSQKVYGWEEVPTPANSFADCFWVNGGDKSSNMLGLRNGYVTDIETNPNQPGQIWTSYGAATIGDGDTTKKIYQSNNWGIIGTWEPFVEGFPEGIPVRKLLYDHKYNRLYCASDIGVWVRDLDSTNSNSEWVEFNNNLPFKIVTDLEILYSQGKIRAATYGRGIWESPIYCKYDAENPYTVSGTETWDEDRIMTSDIIIPSGAELIIDSCNVFMPTNTKIIVKRNAHLTLNNAHISNACDNLWMGIEVWGDPSEAHDTTYQGHVKSTGGTLIENAYCAMVAGKKDANGNGVQGFGGGILQIQNTTFRNNKRAVELWPYPGSFNSYFKSCTFETTEALLDDYDFEYFIVMHSYSPLIIKGCTFQNLREAEELPAHNRGIGIYSLESAFHLSKDSTAFYQQENYFNNLNYGIKALNNFIRHGQLIEHTNFNANITGAYISGSLKHLQVTENNFEVVSYHAQYNNYIYCGLYLDNCTGYLVEGNHFNNSTIAPEFRPDEVIGITVNNSGSEANEIYRNFFDGMDYGILAQNNNRNDADKGLVLKCNDFGLTTENHEFDIAVTAFAGCPFPGIKIDQGSNEDQSTPAGNKFSHNGYWHGDYHNEEDTIYYFQHKPDYEPRVEPLKYSDSTIVVPPLVQDYDSIYSCQSRISNLNEEGVKNEIARSASKADSVNQLLLALVDGGSTDELQSDIALSTPPEAYTVYNDLIMKSPYLTDTVMIEAIDKEDVLGPVMVKEVLVANPQAAKSQEVMSELDERINPLPDYMIDEIEQGRFILGDKEVMEAAKSQHLHAKAIYENMLKLAYYNNLSEPGYTDSLLNLLISINTVSSDYELAFEYLRQGEYSNATSAMNDISNKFTLNAVQQSEYQSYLIIWPLMLDIYQNNRDILNLDSNEISLLDSLAADIYSMPGAIARNILLFNNQSDYEEPYLLPDTSLKNLIIWQEDMDMSDNSPPRFRLYPNPSSSYVAVEYNLDKESCNGIIQIANNSGQHIRNVAVSSNKYSVIIPTNDLPSGVYIVSLKCNGQILNSEKLIISH